MNNNLEKDFTTGNATKKLIEVTIPVLIAFIFSMAYNIVDSLWVGNLLGEKAMAALTVSMPPILLTTSIAMGATNGVAILLSKYVGAKDKENQNKVISISCIVAFIFSITITVICEFSAKTILNLLNTPSEIYPMAKEYLILYMIGYVFVFMYLYFTAVLRSFGNTTMQMVSIILCTMLNIILDPIFINKMGLKGAAIATLLSQGIMMVIMIVYIIKKKLIVIDFKLFYKNTLKELTLKAIPSIIQQSIPAISTSFITYLISAFGVLAIAAFGISGKVETILFYPAMALNMTITTCTGQCFGAKNIKKVKEYLKSGILLGSGFLIVLTIIVVFFSKNLAQMFGANESVKDLVKVYFLIISVGYTCNVITNCVLGAINGFGKPMSAMLLMIFYYIIVRMPLAKILSINKLGLNGIWIAVLISHIAATIAAICYFKVLLKKDYKKLSC
ncbi:MATE family efflux transporter [Clostridium botulinum]|uniref:MATE family efflux transporter n=1 Tax=Clostridium botulinum TaxID=1491 RepID=UPI0004D5CA31|nr:MATE family efflux transporter [Clostridium botulinum]KEH98022.1 multidrug transporter MATE [Clostridium botulinum D str. 16868]